MLRQHFGSGNHRRIALDFFRVSGPTSPLNSQRRFWVKNPEIFRASGPTSSLNSRVIFMKTFRFQKSSSFNSIPDIFCLKVSVYFLDFPDSQSVRRPGLSDIPQISQFRKNIKPHDLEKIPLISRFEISTINPCGRNKTNNQ